MKAVVAAFNQEKALVGAFSVIVKTGCWTDGSFYSTSRYPQSGGHTHHSLNILTKPKRCFETCKRHFQPKQSSDRWQKSVVPATEWWWQSRDNNNNNSSSSSSSVVACVGARPQHSADWWGAVYHEPGSTHCSVVLLIVITWLGVLLSVCCIAQNIV